MEPLSIERSYEVSDSQSQAIQDRAWIFVNDGRVGKPTGSSTTFLQGHQQKAKYLLRNQNKGKGFYPKDFKYLEEISESYESIVGLNTSYSEEFLQRVRNFFNDAHALTDGIKTGDRSFIGKRNYARVRKQIVLEGNEYFWDLHFFCTSDLLDKLWKEELIENLQELDRDELSRLMSEAEYMKQRTKRDRRENQNKATDSR